MTRHVPLVILSPATLIFLLASQACAAIDGFVLNGTTGKPQQGSTVTLFQTTQQGPQNLGSVKTDATGKFVFTQDVQAGVGGGPLLLQAVYDGVQYNKTLPPGVYSTESASLLTDPESINRNG